MTTELQTERPGPSGISWRVWRIAGVIVLGAILSMLDGSIVNVGLNTIARDLGVDLEDVQWVSSAYLLALAVSLPLCGWLGRRIGVGRLWLASLAMFVVFSGLCALAPSLGWLLVFRVAQGLAAGLLVPAGQTILGQAVGPRHLGRVMSILGVAVSFAPAIGPALGGIIIASWSWPWLFLLNLPIGAAALILGTRLVPRGDRQRSDPLDWSGLALLSLGLPMVVYAVTSWGELGRPTLVGVVLPLAIGVSGLAGFVVHARRTRRRPLTDLRLFAKPVYRAGILCSVFIGAAQFGALLLLPLFFQIGRGEDTIETGLALISYGLGSAITLPLAGKLTDRRGGGLISVVGCLLTIVAIIPFAQLPLDANPWLIQALLLAGGMALGLAAVPPTVAAYAAVRSDQLPDATVQLNIVQRIGGAVGGALMATVLAGGLPAGKQVAFTQTFWWLTGVSAAALLSALYLWFAQLRTQNERWTAPTTTRQPAGLEQYQA